MFNEIKLKFNLKSTEISFFTSFILTVNLSGYFW